jgi:hypothetical protein
MYVVRLEYWSAGMKMVEGFQNAVVTVDTKEFVNSIV